MKHHDTKDQVADAEFAEELLPFAEFAGLRGSSKKRTDGKLSRIQRASRHYRDIEFRLSIAEPSANTLLEWAFRAVGAHSLHEHRSARFQMRGKTFDNRANNLFPVLATIVINPFRAEHRNVRRVRDDAVEPSSSNGLV